MITYSNVQMYGAWFWDSPVAVGIAVYWQGEVYQRMHVFFVSLQVWQVTSPLNKCPTLKVWHPPLSGASKPNFSGRTVLTKNPPLFDASDVDGEDDGDQDDDHGHCVMVVMIGLSFLWFPMITDLETAESQCRVGFSWHLDMLWMLM